MMVDANNSRAAAPTYARTCTECGAGFTAESARADFCSNPCRKAWNNRRMVRGAELYDLFMALRFDRKAATKLKVWKLICRMAGGFREEDWRDRDGRLSWRSPRKVLGRRGYLFATVVKRGRG